MTYSKDENGHKVIRIKTNNVLPILTLCVLIFGTILFLIFAFMVGTHYSDVTYPSNPTAGQEFTINQGSGLWTISAKFVYTTNGWEHKSTSYGLSAGGISSMIFVVSGIVLYTCNAMKLQSTTDKCWFKLLSGVVVVMLIVIIWTMVHQYIAFPQYYN